MKPGDPCPRCGGQLVTKTGPKGPFLGCTNYRSQACKFTAPIPAPAQEPDEDDITDPDMLLEIVKRLDAVESKLDLLLAAAKFVPRGTA